jgi:hypothetical protein
MEGPFPERAQPEPVDGQPRSFESDRIVVLKGVDAASVPTLISEAKAALTVANEKRSAERSQSPDFLEGLHNGLRLRGYGVELGRPLLVGHRQSGFRF